MRSRGLGGVCQAAAPQTAAPRKPAFVGTAVAIKGGEGSWLCRC
jgi:hypothetical protein